MSKMIFVNLPVANLQASMDFYEALGFENNPKLSDAASANGGTADINPKQDHGFMFGRSLADLDGHVWEMMWMDPGAMQG